MAEEQVMRMSVDPSKSLAFGVALHEMGERRPLLRLRLRRAASNPALCDYLSLKYAAEMDAAPVFAPAVGAEGDGPFIAFIKWIIENQDSIIAFIQAIIALF